MSSFGNEQSLHHYIRRHFERVSQQANPVMLQRPVNPAYPHLNHPGRPNEEQ